MNHGRCTAPRRRCVTSWRCTCKEDVLFRKFSLSVSFLMPSSACGEHFVGVSVSCFSNSWKQQWEEIFLLPSARWRWSLWGAVSRCPRCRCAGCVAPGSAGTSASPPALGKPRPPWTAAAGPDNLDKEKEETEPHERRLTRALYFELDVNILSTGSTEAKTKRKCCCLGI